MPEITYSQLDSILRGLGFTSYDVTDEPATRVYQHEFTGARVYIPILPPNQVVHRFHLRGTQVTLDNFGVLTQSEFEDRLRKVG